MQTDTYLQLLGGWWHNSEGDFFNNMSTIFMSKSWLLEEQQRVEYAI